MRSAKTTARVIGALLLVQLAGLTVPFILLLPLTTPPGFLGKRRGKFFSDQAGGRSLVCKWDVDDRHHDRGITHISPA